MNRSQRAKLAEDTLAIINRGSYTSADGETVNIQAAVQRCTQDARLYSPDQLKELRESVLQQRVDGKLTTHETEFEVTAETTLEAARRLVVSDGEANTMASPDQIVAALNKKFSGADFTATPLLMRGDEPGDQMFIRVEPAQLIDVLSFLRDDAALKFEQLIDVTCVDYLNFPNATDRYGVVYSLLSHTHGHRIWIKAFVNDPDPKLASATCVWKGADWMEREVFDMLYLHQRRRQPPNRPRGQARRTPKDAKAAATDGFS